MAKNIDFMGAVFPDVPSVKLPQQGGGLVSFDDTTDANATAGDIAQGKTAYVNGAKITGTAQGGGGGGPALQLLGTKSLGTISTSSTSATSLGQTMTVSDINDYDLLILEVSVDTIVNNRHVATIYPCYLTALSTVETKNGQYGLSVLNAKCSSAGVISTRSGSSAYGVYGTPSIGTDEMTYDLKARYNSTNTGTINGSYTARVYGVNLCDLIGG